MTNRYKNRRNAIVNLPFEGKHCKTYEQSVRRHARNVMKRELRAALAAIDHNRCKGGVSNAY